LAVAPDALPFEGKLTNLVICDRASMEAIASAQVLKCLLTPKFSHSPADTPFVHQNGPTDLPAELKMILVVCTNGAFQQKDFLLTLYAAGKKEVSSIPILADESFRFPDKAFMQTNEAALKGISDTVAPATMALLVLDVFKAIAVVFQPEQYSSTEVVLDTKTQEISDRMQNPSLLQKLVLQTNAKPEDV